MHTQHAANHELETLLELVQHVTRVIRILSSREGAGPQPHASLIQPQTHKVFSFVVGNILTQQQISKKTFTITEIWGAFTRPTLRVRRFVTQSRVHLLTDEQAYVDAEAGEILCTRRTDAPQASLALLSSMDESIRPIFPMSLKI
jgi:hypothetical protein